MIRNLKNGEAVLLENLRFLKEEFNLSKKNKLIEILGKECDYYINDAFSVSHRKQTSIIGFPKILKSGIGRLMEIELSNLNKIKTSNSLFILGGSKIDDIMLLANKKRIISTGVFSLLCLKAKKIKLGLEDNILKDKNKFIPLINKNIKNIKTPIDLAVEFNGKRKEINITSLPTNKKILDIGKNTVKLYSKEIKKANSIFWKGTAGYCEKKEFSFGTEKLLKEIEKSKKFCVIAGGHSSEALEMFKINKKRISYVSLSGGALLYYITGKKLPGLEALKKNNLNTNKNQKNRKEKC